MLSTVDSTSSASKRHSSKREPATIPPSPPLPASPESPAVAVSPTATATRISHDLLAQPNAKLPELVKATASKKDDYGATNGQANSKPVASTMKDEDVGLPRNKPKPKESKIVRTDQKITAGSQKRSSMEALPNELERKQRPRLSQMGRHTSEDGRVSSSNIESSIGSSQGRAENVKTQVEAETTPSRKRPGTKNGESSQPSTSTAVSLEQGSSNEGASRMASESLVVAPSAAKMGNQPPLASVVAESAARKERSSEERKAIKGERRQPVNDNAGVVADGVASNAAVGSIQAREQKLEAKRTKYERLLKRRREGINAENDARCQNIQAKIDEIDDKLLDLIDEMD